MNKLMSFDADQISQVRKLLGSSNRPHSPKLQDKTEITENIEAWVNVTEVVDPATNPETYKGIEVKRDGSDIEIIDYFLFDSDASSSGPTDQVRYFNDIEALPGASGTIEVDGVYKLLIFQDNKDGAVTFYLEPQGGGGGDSLRYFQVTDVDYTKNNDQNSSSFIYRGVEVASIDTLPVPPPAEVDKQDIIIHTGYPWNLVAGDNLLVLQELEGSGIIIAQNIVEPEPVIKVVSGSIEVWDKEVGGVSLTVVKPGYRIMSGPSVLLSTYDDLFLIAQWSKRSNLVRIYLPTI